MMSKCHCGRPFAIFAFLGKLMHIWTIGVFSCTFAFARQEHSPPTAFHLSGLPQLRFVDTVASQLEEKPGAKNWPGGKKGQNWGKMEKSVGLRGANIACRQLLSEERCQIINVEAVSLSRCCKLYSLCNHCDCR